MLETHLELVQQGLKEIKGLIPEGSDLLTRTRKVEQSVFETVQPGEKRVGSDHRLRMCTVSSDLVVKLLDQTSDREPLQVIIDRSADWKMTREDVAQVKLKTVLVGNDLHYECVLTLKEKNEKIRFMSNSADKIRQLFNWVKMPEQPTTCKLLALQKSRVAYVRGHVAPDVNEHPLMKKLSVVLQQEYNIGLQREPDDGAGKFPYVLFYLFMQPSSRLPQTEDLARWSGDANKRSGGNGVWLIVVPDQYKNSVQPVDSRMLPQSGLFMNEPQKSIPRVLSILAKPEDQYEETAVHELAKEMCLLVDKVSGDGLD